MLQVRMPKIKQSDIFFIPYKYKLPTVNYRIIIMEGMSQILRELGLSNLINLFDSNSVGPREVLTLTENEFHDLGIQTIGDRARIRQRCRLYVNGHFESAALKKFKELTGKGRNSYHPKKKNDRKLYLGWKHSSGAGYKQVPLTLGGGSVIVTLPKECSLPELEKKFIMTFFPGGIATQKKVDLLDCEMFVGNFAGVRLTSKLVNGQNFSLEGYCNELQTSPVRLYLYTQLKSNGVQTTSLLTSQVTLAVHTSHSQSIFTSPVTTVQTATATPFIPAIPTTTILTPLNPTMQTTQSQMTEDDPFEVSGLFFSSFEDDDKLPDIPSSSGTPTITFKQRKELKSLQDVLYELYSQILTDGERNIVNVSRSEIISGTRRAFTRKKFDPRKGLSVKFAGENGIDDGGPSRELLQLLINSVKDSPIFQGTDCKMLCPDVQSEERGDYYLFGMIISYSVVHRGPAPQFFAPILFDLIAFGSCQPTIDDIVDYDIQKHVQQLSFADDSVSLQEAAQPIISHIDFLGAISLLLDIKHKDKLLKLLLQYFVVERIRGVLDKFCEGLDCLGLRKEVRKYPEAMRELFVHSHQTLTAACVDNLFNPIYSENSQALLEELRTCSYWRDFLQDLEEAGELGKLLCFVTGLEDIPPLGFEPKLSILFKHPTIDLEMVPFANTCTNTITIPVLKDYDDFKTIMDNSLRFGYLFTDP